MLGLVTPDFWGFRRLWFALNFGFVVAVAVLVARSLDERLGTHAVWLTPFVIAGPAIVGTFQAGNAQMLMIALSALSFTSSIDAPRHRRGAARLRDRRQALSGCVRALPAAARDWRAVGWTAAFGVALLGVSFADVGWAPYGAFLNEMPGLMSGEAFSAFRNPNAIAANGSVPGSFQAGCGACRTWASTRCASSAGSTPIVIVAGTVWLVKRVRPAGT